nr:SpoIIE family protein phosphatase [Acidobacteriota bacterium]
SIATGVAVGFTLVVFALGGISAAVGRPPPGGQVLPWIGAVLYLGTLVVYLLVIGRYRLLESDLRVRRNVQYLVISTAWTLLICAAGLWFWWLMVHIELPLPHVRLTGQAIEVLPTAIDPERRALIDKGVLIAAAVVFAYGFRALLKRGHRFLAEQYYQEGYDYRRASREFSDVMGPRMDLDGLADGLLTVLDRLMPVKRAGVVFVQGNRLISSRRSIGFETGDWDIFCSGCVDEAVAVLKGARGTELDTEYAPPRLRLSLRRAEIHHLYPIGGHNELRGVLFIGEKLSESAYTADDFAFLGVMAGQAALLVENAFLYENLAAQARVRQELAIARRIQLESLPQRAPRVPGLEIAGTSLPAQEVGGDYFDYLGGADGQVTVMIGDVSGKGTSAALYMSKLQGIIRSLHGFGLTPRQLFVRTNELLGHDMDRRAFVTVLGAFFDTTTRTLVLVRAGHLPLLHYHAATGEVTRWLPRGLGLGLTQRVLFATELEECRIPYAPGDVFLFVTDGITESHDPSGDDYGEDRLVASLSTLAAARTPVETMLAAINRSASEFAAGAPQHDDQTVVVIRAL